MTKTYYNFFRRFAIGFTAFIKSFNNPEREKEIIFENEKVNIDGGSDYKKKIYNFIRSHSENNKQITAKLLCFIKSMPKKAE